MRRIPWLALALTVAMLGSVPEATAHGGTYAFPGIGKGAAPAPGAGAGGPGVAPSSSPGAFGPVAPGPTGAPERRRPSTPAPGSGPEADDWSHWWRLNQHEYLLLKDAVWDSGPVTGSATFALGAGQRRAPNHALRPSERQLAELVAPGLKRALASEGQPQVLSGLLMALAKLGELPVEQGASTSGATLLGFLPHANQEVRETAALALGVLGDPAWLDELAGLCADDQRALALLGRTGANVRTRAFAAYGLGLLAQRCQRVDVQRYVAHQLVERLQAGERGAHELPVACLNALALVQLPAGDPELGAATPASSRAALIEHLLTLLDERRLPDRVKAHVPRTLARLVDPYDDPLKERVAAELVSRATRGQRFERQLQYGAIQALGVLGTAGSRPVDVRIRRALDDAYANGDLNARNLSLIAMAKLAARPHPGSPDPLAGAEPIRARLSEAFARGKSRTRPWAALALGVHGFHARAAGLALSPDVTLALRRELDETRSAADAGAVALALGLRSDKAAGERLIEGLDEFRVDATRSHFALALGLLGEAAAGTALRAQLEQATWRPELFRSVAIALALIGDKQLVPRLEQAMGAANSSAVRAVHAWALAWTGDARAIGPLLALLGDPDVPVPAREVAGVALGWTSERQRLPWKTWLASDVNHHAAPPTLTSPAGGGLLDIH